MSAASARLSLIFSCIGHTYVHVFTVFYATIVVALEVSWDRPYHELIELWTLGALLVGLCALPAGWLADRWSAAGMMVVYFLGMGAAGIACGLVDGPLALLIGLAAIGVFSSIYHPVGIAWLVRNAKSRGITLGINGLFGGIGIALAALVSGALIDFYGWRAAFIVPGVICMLTGVALLVCVRLGLVVEGGSDRSPEPAPGRGDMLRAFATLLITMFCMGLVFQASQTAFPKVFDLRLRDLAGEGMLGIGVIVFLVYGLGSLMQILGGVLADRYPLKPVYLFSLLLQIPALAVVAGLSGVPLVAMALLAVMLSTGAVPAENMLLARFTPEHRRSLAFGIKFVLAFGSAPLAIWMIALINERTGEFYWLFMSLAALTAISTLTAIMLPGEWRRRPVAVPAE